MNGTLAHKTLLAGGLLTATLATMGATCSAAVAGGTGGASAPTVATAKPLTALHAKSRPKGGSQVATWFGPGFYGQKTACGQTMTPVVVGVASRTLPCGTLVLVNYKGHTLTVPVIDRGPYADGVTWDLTWGAASALEITETVRVKTKIVGHAANSPLLGAPAEVALPPLAASSGGTAPAASPASA